MPTKGTVVIPIRVREELRNAIDKEAKRRKMTRNRMLALGLEADYSCGPDSHETDEIPHGTGVPGLRDDDDD